MTVVLTIIGGILVLAGLAGCVFPVLPGPPVSYLSLILISFAYGWRAFSPGLLILMGAVTVVVTLLDFILPVYLPRRYGASRYGVWGSVVGMIAGLVFFPPFGMLIGTFLGAVAGELAFNWDRRVTLRAALGVFMGTLTSTLLKLATSGIIGFYFFLAVFRGTLPG
ncbi:MAG: DUF456 domain-containing protein [Spirochaetota bacterium]